MAITPGDDVKDAPEPLPRGPLVEQGGQLSRSFFNWFQGKDRKLGEIISGVNLNRQNIVQLQTDYQAADGAISSAYIAADAIVASDAASARATLSTTLTAAFQSADSTISASVSTNATAIASLEGAAASYEIIAAASGGNPARIKLKAGVGGADVELDADRIWFGAQTEFDTASETFITEVGGIRSRYGTAFGNVSSQVVMWHGPTSVVQGSESRTNGYLAIGTDGQIYHNTAALNWGATAAEAAASNALVPVGQNRLRYSRGERITGYWTFFSNGSSASFAAFVFGGYTGLKIDGSFSAAGQVFSIFRSDRFAVTAGEKLGVSALVEAVNCDFGAIRVHFRDGSETNLGFTDVGGWSGASLLTTLRGGTMTVPANATRAYVEIFMFSAGSGAGSLACADVMIAGIPATTTATPVWNPGPDADALADITGDNTAAAITGQGTDATANTGRGNTASRPASTGGWNKYLNTETGFLQFDVPVDGWIDIAPIGAALRATVSGSYTDIRVGTGTRNTGSITITATGGAGSYTYSHQLIITDNPSAVSVTLNSPTSATFSVSSPSNSPVKLVTFIVISTITDAAGTIFQITRGGALGWES